MVSQPKRFTKSFASYLQHFKMRFRCESKRLVSLGALLLLSVQAIQPAMALVKMDSKSIDAALVYGMRHKDLGLANLLGPNWIEGQNGILLNVYSPFMMIAGKAAKADLSKRPASSDLKKARQRFGREVAFYSDPHNKITVKFSVSFYGDSPDFAKSYMARIHGFGRGKEFDIKTSKQVLDQKADPIANGQVGGSYEAINAYYFNFADLEDLQDFSLIMESPSGPPVEFHMKNDRLY